MEPCPLSRNGIANLMFSDTASSRRAVGLALCCVAAWLNTAAWRPTPSIGWFAPVFFLKLLARHAAGASPEKEQHLQTTCLRCTGISSLKILSKGRDGYHQPYPVMLTRCTEGAA
jgi:hypothetical protein